MKYYLILRDEAAKQLRELYPDKTFGRILNDVVEEHLAARIRKQEEVVKLKEDLSIPCVVRGCGKAATVTVESKGGSVSFVCTKHKGNYVESGLWTVKAAAIPGGELK